jgi:hypothetical protein
MDEINVEVSYVIPVYTKNTQNPQGSTNETIDRSIQSMHSQQIQPDIKIVCNVDYDHEMVCDYSLVHDVVQNFVMEQYVTHDYTLARNEVHYVYSYKTIDRSIQSMHSQQIQPDIKINSTHGETQQSSSTSISNCQKNSEVVKTILFHVEHVHVVLNNVWWFCV